MFQANLKSKEDEDICILVHVDNHPWQYLCECGDASGLSVKECQNIRAIFLSHTHLDHFANFDQILRHQIGIGRTVTIVGPKDIARQVQARLKSYTWNLIQEGALRYEIREIINPQQINVFSIAPPLWELKEQEPFTGNTVFTDPAFQVDCTILDHKIPSIAYRFKEADTIKMNISDSGFSGGKWVRDLKEAFIAHKPQTPIEIGAEMYVAEDLFHLLSKKTGDSLGVIMDHAANPENHSKIKALFTDCNKVFIEAFYKKEDSELAKLNYHSYTSESAKIMKVCQVKEAIPVHFSRKYDAAEIQSLKEEFAEVYKI